MNNRVTPNGPVQGLHLHLAPSTGIAGDMAVAALVDTGVPDKVVVEAVQAMHVPGLVVGFHEDPEIAGLHFEVSWAAHHGHAHDHEHPTGAHDGHHHDHRPYAEIRRMLQAANLSAGCRALAEKMFARLAGVLGVRQGELEAVGARGEVRHVHQVRRARRP